MTKTEIIVTYHGQNGTSRTAYRSHELASKGMMNELKIPGTMVASIFERNREDGRYNSKDYPELS